MTGVGILLRSFLRRDRWLLVWWPLGGMLLYWSQAVSIEGLYATQAEFDRAALAMESNPAFIAMAGPARALNTIGGQVTWQATAFGAVVAGLMTMFIIGRHTRAEEESGRDELLRSGAIGRRAPLTAALAVAGIANLLFGGLIAVSLISVPLAVADSVALGVGVGLFGMAFAGVSLLAAQLTASTRSVYGITGAVLAGSYALRAVGDVGNETLSWLSPIGWYQRMYAFSGLRWWPALLLVALAVLVLLAAYAVFERRDIGSGVLAARPGPDRATPALGTPLGLAWRLQRGSVVGWMLGMAFVGLSYGSIGDGAGDLVGDNEAAREMFAAGGVDLVAGFQAIAMVMIAMISSAFAIASVLRARAEEESGRLEPLLATGVSRIRWLLSHVAVTVVGSVLVVAAGGLGMGVGYGLVTGDAGAPWRFTWQTSAWLPAVLALAGLTRLLYGIRPRLATAGWLGLAFVAVVLLLGEVLRFPDWLRDVSPFEHLALQPVAEFDAVAFAAVLAAAALMGVAGWFGFARRDVG
ncbi:ABC transporter permease [Nocardioides coralli]|uniref:ABC transporter permease n=1 Tax=Nocardioides coralli TaxID=2872154 RepID=UPI001CA3D0B4|nr:hypothetical protein [Nocardioides coralli]QZY27603.1 hypothetical protein K6T13_08685 [Nocardioides coralli]